MKGTRLLAIARKEVIQLRRDTRSLILAFMLPVLLVILFGYAISWDVNDIETAVLDQDQSARIRELLDAFWSSGYFTLVARLQRSADIDRLLDAGRIRIALVIPPDFARDLDAGRTAQVQAITDGSDANTATITLGYAGAIISSYSMRARIGGFRPTSPSSLGRASGTTKSC